VILLDTTPLVALCDPRDALHRTASRDLDRVATQQLVLCDPVIAEVCFLLRREHQRERVRRFLVTFSVVAYHDDDQAELWAEVFDWLARCRDHDPDWADGYLAVVSGKRKGSKVWTYDREFRTTWRRPDGTRIPLAV
jgi:predicted nucleic acid-binding protein